MAKLAGSSVNGPRKIAPPPKFEIVKNPLPVDAFHRRLPSGSKRHYYVDALTDLAKAKRGSVLRFASRKAHAGLTRAAKKLGYELHFALEGTGEQEALFVQIVDTGDDK